MLRSPLNRRTVLRGIGTGLALPLLEAMRPALAAAGSPVLTPPVRSAFLFFPNGAIMDQWSPQGEGRDYQLSPTLKPLDSFREDMIVFGGLAQHHARANGDGAGDHARNASAFLTGAQPRKTSGADIRAGISIDQAIAHQIGAATRLPSLELGIDRGRNAGSCDSGYSCAYSNNISWTSESTPTAKEISPRAAFERLFGNPDSAADEERKRENRRSILDFVSEDARRIRKQVSGADRQKLDEYFTSVREIEERLGRANDLPRQIPEMIIPEGMPAAFPEHVRLMYDILTVAFQSDSTRVATLMIGNAGSNRSYPDVDVNDGHHQLSHHQKDEKKIEKITRIDKFLVEQFAFFLKRLKETPEGDGNLLDNSMILYGSAISDGNRHQHHDLPIILAGRGGGRVNSGRRVVMNEETPLNNLFLAMAERMGAPLKELGDSTGTLDLS